MTPDGAVGRSIIQARGRLTTNRNRNATWLTASRDHSPRRYPIRLRDYAAIEGFRKR